MDMTDLREEHLGGFKKRVSSDSNPERAEPNPSRSLPFGRGGGRRSMIVAITADKLKAKFSHG
jgi:hypothetical protein